MTLGKVSIAIDAQMAQFESDMGRAARVAEKEFKKVERDAARMEGELKRIGKAAGMAIAAGLTAAGGAAVVFARDMTRVAAEIERFSTLSGTSTDVFQKWAAGAATVGIEQDKLADILKDMQDRVGDFIQTGGGPMADFFENIAPAVGVTADQFARLSGPEALQLFVKSLEDANLSSNDFVFYMEAIASDSTLLLPLLRDNGEAMRRLGEEAAAAGSIMGTETLNAAAALKREMLELDRSTQALRNQLAAELLPVMADLLAEFNRIITDGDNVKVTVDSIVVAFEGIVSIGGSVVSTGESIRSVLSGIGGDAQDGAESLRQLIQSARGLAAIPASMAAYLDAQVTGSEEAVARFNKANAEIKAGWNGTAVPAYQNPMENVPSPIQFPDFSGSSPTFSAVPFRAFNPVEGGNGIKAPNAAERKAAEEAAAGSKARSSATRELTEAQKAYNEQEEIYGEIMQMTSRFETDAIIRAGQIAERRDDEAARQAERAQDVMTQIKDEIGLVGASAEAQEIWNNLKWAGVDADSAFGKQIAESTAELQRQRDQMDDQIYAMDGLRDSARGFLDDLRAGEGVWDSLKSAADNFADVLWEIAANNLIEGLFGKQGESGGGGFDFGKMFGSFFGGGEGGGASGGGEGVDWGGMLASFFGGSRANGGPVSAGSFYEVGEMNRPEMFSSGGRSYLIPGNNGAVAPMRGGGSVIQNFTQVVQGQMTLRTSEQAARKTGQAARRGMARTGA